MAAFRAAIAIGAGIECDVRLSADGQVLIFHDHDLRRMCASGLAVESSSARQLMAQRLFDSEEHIPRLDELLELAAWSVPLLIELKCRSGNDALLSEAVANALDGYSGPVGVMSFEPGAIQWFARHRADRKRGLVISKRASAPDRWNGLRKATPHFLAVELAAIHRNWVKRERRQRAVYCWTIRDGPARQTAAIHADAPIWEADGRPGS